MSTIEEPKVDDILDGSILNIFEKYALVSLHDNFVGRLHNKQITWFSNEKAAARKFIVGAHIKVIVRQVRYSNKTGNILIELGYRELLPNPWDSVESRFPTGTRAEGKIIEISEYGAIVEFEYGYTGLLHNSELSWTDRNAKISQNFSIDENISVLIKNSANHQLGMLLSHRETQPAPMSELIVGSQTTGKITNILSHGIFLELQNKCIAFLHHSKVSANFDGSLDDILDIEIETIDLSKRRISVSLLKTENST